MWSMVYLWGGLALSNYIVTLVVDSTADVRFTDYGCTIRSLVCGWRDTT